MSRLTGRILLGAVLVAARIAAAPAATPAVPEIRQILVERIDQRHQGVGMVVGVIDSGGRRVVGYGVRGIDDPRPVDGDTVFEIGSMTKVFTSLLLADMARRGDVELTDPVAKRDFFAKAVDAQITFELAGDGRATKLILHQGGLSQAAGRLE